MPTAGPPESSVASRISRHSTMRDFAAWGSPRIRECPDMRIRAIFVVVGLAGLTSKRAPVTLSWEGALFPMPPCSEEAGDAGCPR
jgi:hypothetical protein